MNGLTWNYIEPTPIESSGLVASNLQANQQGLANGMAGLQRVRDIAQAAEANRQNAQTLGMYGLMASIPNTEVQTNPNVGISVDTTNPSSVTMPNTYVNPTVPISSESEGLVGKTPTPTQATPTVTPKVESGSGLARASVERAKPYMGIVQAASKAYGVPEDVILAVIETESGFKPDAKSATGVRGIMQVTQSTYDGLGFKGDRSDPTNSINAGTKLLSQLYRQYGNWDDAFSAYNGGADAVRGLRTGNWGVWSDNPNKQREINQYASRVNSYRTAWSS